MEEPMEEFIHDLVGHVVDPDGLLVQLISNDAA